jgi:hypothetical protein
MQFICLENAATSAAVRRAVGEHSGSHHYQMVRPFHASKSAARARRIAPEAGALPNPTASFRPGSCDKATELHADKKMDSDFKGEHGITRAFQ